MSKEILTRAYRHYQTAFHIPAEDVLPLIGNAKRVFLAKLGSWIDTSSTRLLPFRDSLVCYACGKRGSFFAVQRHLQLHGGRKWHINLYTEDGHLMTCDHVVPKSAWPLGQRHLADDPGNLRTLCQRCNSKKSSRSIEQFMSNRTFHY